MTAETVEAIERPATGTTTLQERRAAVTSGYRPSRLLAPDEFTLEWTPTGVLRVIVTPTPTDPPAVAERPDGRRVYEPVRVTALQPLSDPDRYIAVCTGHPKQVEIGVIPDLAHLPPDEQQVLREALDRRQLTLTIQRINSIREEYGFLTWQVATNHGPRTFTMPRWNQSYVTEYGAEDKGRLIYDVYWNRYVIPDLAALDRRSRKRFGRYIYW